MHHSSGAAAVSTVPKYLLPPGEPHNYYKHEVAQSDSRDNFCLFHSLPLAFYVDGAGSAVIPVGAGLGMTNQSPPPRQEFIRGL